MQVSSSTINIEDYDKKQIYLQIMSDKFCMRIISSIINHSKTAVEISKETTIPISTVYRRLQLLQEKTVSPQEFEKCLFYRFYIKHYNQKL